MKKILCLFMILLCISSVCFASGDYDLPEYTFKTLRGQVVEAGEVYEESVGYDTFKYQDVKVFIKDQGYTTTKVIKYSISYYSDVTITNQPLKKGDKVYVYTTFENGKMTSTEISYKNNNGYLLAIVLLYAGAIVIIGGVKGIKALVSLIITVLAIFIFVIPKIMAGANPLLITIIISILITIISLVIIAGFNKKALAAIIGTSGGFIIAGIFAVIFGNLMQLSGVCEDARLLIGVMDTSTIDFKGILFSGIIIGALGACMDVSMSIASALYELKCEVPDITVGKMIKAGMNIGKDMMGTMTNTLILAYTGGAIITIMIFMGANLAFYEVINQEMMIEEVLRAIAGSFGLVATIPFTTVITSLLFCGGNKGGEYGRK